ncbi:hypothetical protein AX14_010967 [Amanita brunnescens Koide BX004]|nr:hypothetical protein AX14_010967 [Amanita brunnescens Koide BX004]
MEKSTTETSGEKVTYAYTTYKEQEVVIVEFVDFSAQHVWNRLVANEKKQILIDWTTEPGPGQKILEREGCRIVAEETREMGGMLATRGFSSWRMTSYMTALRIYNAYRVSP